MPRKAPIISVGVDLDSVDVAELLESTGDGSRGGYRCWAYNANGKLKDYLDGCRKRVKEGKPFRMRRALEVAQENLGVTVKIAAFRNHVMGRCSCK